jgi:hypothetical protein
VIKRVSVGPETNRFALIPPLRRQKMRFRSG